jgi:hypothetical protein
MTTVSAEVSLPANADKVWPWPVISTAFPAGIREPLSAESSSD